MTSAIRDTVPPFLRLNASTGWPLGDALSRPGIVSLHGPLKLAVAGATAIAVNEPFGSFGGKRLPRGVAISPTGRMFIADPAARVIWTAQGSSHDGPAVFVPLWPARDLPPAPKPEDVAPPSAIPADPYALVSPSDVLLLPNGDVAIADPGASRVLVIAFPTAQLRQVITIEGGAPTALACDSQGRTYIADPANRTIYRYDTLWRRDPSFPRGSADLDAPAFLASPMKASGFACNCAEDCGGSCGGACGDHATGPQAVIYTLNDGKIIGLDERGYRVAELDPAPLLLSPPALSFGQGGSLFFADPALPGHEPVKLTGLTLTGDGRIKDIGVPLVAMPVRVPVPRSGNFVTRALDSGQAGFIWDRVTLRCTLPANTRLLVQSLTSDSAIEFDRILKTPDDEWSAPLSLQTPTDPNAPPLAPEVLIQSGAGRHLWLRITLFSDGTVSPVIDEIDIYGPRRSAMRYLPASFHQDPESVSFLDRFLSYFDTVHAEISASNRGIAAMFDPYASPEGAFLDWLGSWFDINFLAEWDEATRRDMIAQAMHYHSIRGTVAGLKKMLQWHTGLAEPLPQIIEHFRFAGGTGPSIGGSPLDTSAIAHSATIVLPRSVVPDALSQARLAKLVSKNAPAHVRINLRLIEPGISIGSQSTIGVDTLIGGLSPQGLGLGHLGLDFSTDGPLQSGIAAVRSAVPERNLSC